MHGMPEYVVSRRMSFLTAMALGASAVMVTGVVCGTGVLCYGLSILDRKANNVVTLARAALDGLPELRKNLPPVLADVIQDARRPDYVAKLAVNARLVEEADREGRYRAVVEIKNNGDQVVSLLAVRAVVLDAKQAPISEWTEYLATPIAGNDGDWRGPLLPGATRRVPLGRLYRNAHCTVACEIADVRIWTPPASSDSVTGDRRRADASDLGAQSDG